MIANYDSTKVYDEPLTAEKIKEIADSFRADIYGDRLYDFQTPDPPTLRCRDCSLFQANHKDKRQDGRCIKGEKDQWRVTEKNPEGIWYPRRGPGNTACKDLKPLQSAVKKAQAIMSRENEKIEIMNRFHADLLARFPAQNVKSANYIWRLATKQRVYERPGLVVDKFAKYLIIALVEKGTIKAPETV